MTNFRVLLTNVLPPLLLIDPHFPAKLLETLPWPSGEVLKWAMEGAVALVLSPLAGRLVVDPALTLYARARLKALATPRKRK